MLNDLTLADGQRFIDSLTNHYNGLPLRPSQKKKYRSALRSFSRFLVGSKIIQDDVLVGLKID
jgi:hypothetical protein